ncbi:MAG TPA: hypothetical protein DGB72_12550 [Gemmatimonadetes bacterium]|jgi:hypothetical protein|nr:hypothetical protein [Gemmatimonadota bacterium]
MSHLSEEQLDQIIAAERSREQAPLNEWRTIAARAREEGLIRDSQSSRRWASSQPWLQSAAAVLLLVGGVAIGRATIALPSAVEGSTVSATPSAMTATSANQSSGSALSSASFASVDEASAALNQAVDAYQRASEFLAVNNASAGSGDSVAMYSARAAALDKIENATVSALRTAPHDPVLNQYYLATMGARVATQQMVARPVGLRGF